MTKYKRGETVWVKTFGVFGKITSLAEIDGDSYLVEWDTPPISGWGWFYPEDLSYEKPDEVIKGYEPQEPVQVKATISDGGPSSYYDWPTDWNTLNDFIEDKSVHQWKGFSFHLGNIVKAVTRWGDKEGTTEEYDAKKIIYSGCRVLKMIVGKDKLRKYLQSLLDDPQFKE